MDHVLHDRVLLHLRSVGFGESQTKAFLKRLGNWIRYSGTEWTCKRLKTLKEYHLKVLEGENPPIPTGWAVYQTRHRKSFKDPMVRMVMDLPNSGASLRKKEAFLRLPTVLRLKDISKSQRNRFMAAVTGPYTGSEEAIATALRAIDRGLEALIGRIDQSVPNSATYLPLRLWAPNDKRAPVIAREKLRKGKTSRLFTVSRKHMLAYDFMTYLSYDKAGQALWRDHPFSVSHCMVGSGEAICIRCAGWQSMTDIPAGRIGFIQEGGCKLRSVASPFLVLQALGEPLKRKLEAITGSIPVIGTFNQSSSHDTIIGWLLRGKEVSSYDLSSFTDRFPVLLQYRVLERLKERGMVTQFDIDVMKMVVDKEWELPGTTIRVKWKVGQPLGFGPSFHLATLTHAALIRGLGESKLFQVVGDDVAIGDPLLSRRYSDLIQALGIEISTSKSLISREYAEFCGKLLTRQGVTPSIKVRLIGGADQLVDVLRYYGPQAISFLSPSERKWLLKVVLPEDLGGLGWQLPGMSHAEWLNTLHTDAIAEHRLVSDLEAFLGLNYASWKEVTEFVSGFDQINNLSDDLSGMLGVSPKGVSGIYSTNLFTHGRVEGPSMVYRHESVFDLIDKAARETVQQLPKLPFWLKSMYFNKFGYINPGEKKPSFQSPDLWSIPDHGKIYHERYTRYLSSTARGLGITER